MRYSRDFEVVSVSDPNDMLSRRPIDNGFADEYIGRALCPTITEVTLAADENFLALCRAYKDMQYPE